MGESVYVGGGGTEYKIFQYSSGSGVWNTLPKCPVKWFGLTQFMGRLTTVGGQDRAGSATALVYELVSESQQWQESPPPMPTARVYELVSESQPWQKSLPPMPTARSGVTVVARPSSSPKPQAIAVCGGDE